MTSSHTQHPLSDDAVPRASAARTVRETVNARIGALQSGYMNDRPDAVAAIARIRRGAGKRINTFPDLWGLTVTDEFYESLEGKAANGRLEKAENAVHIAVTLWALHQQSRRDAPMHVVGGPELGRAVRALMPGNELDEPLRQRFVRIGTATTVDILAQRAREIVLLLRQQAQPMDYGVFAAQLYTWQLPNGPLQVRHAWGRSFHAGRAASADQPIEPADSGKETS